MANKIIQLWQDKAKTMKMFPKSLTKAIYDTDGNRLDNTLTTINGDIASLNTNLEWKYFTQYSDTTAFQVLPTSWKELYLIHYCSIDDVIMTYDHTLPKLVADRWKGTIMSLYGGYQYNSSFGALERLQVDSSNNKISMSAFRINGTDYSAGSHLQIYYR